MASAAKIIKTALPRQNPHWVGNGFQVYPTFAHLAFTKEISPFLMLDYAAPKKWEPSSEKHGVGQHPHRGFETVTLAYQGEVEHADSVGNRGVIGAGDVQWMSAARGIIHEEFHSTKFTRTGGVFEMVQLWVNLPKKDKMNPPRYQPLEDKEFPRVPFPGRDDTSEGYVRVVSGDFNGNKGPALTHTPVNLWDLILHNKDTTVEIPIQSGHNTILFARKGGAVFIDGAGKETIIEAQQAVILGMEGTHFTVKSPKADTQILILSGEPINEPIAARGPFVMNTHDEIMQANADYHSGKLGR